MDIDNLPALSVPSSISALRLEGSPGFIQNTAWENYATEILLTTILWLTASNHIQVRKVTIGQSIFFMRYREYIDYLLYPGQLEAARNAGWLEKEFINSISDEDSCVKSKTLFPGAFIDRAIWSLIGSYQLFPAQIVIHLVSIDAQNKGWGFSSGLVFPQFQPAPDRVEILADDQRETRTLVEKFAAKYPDFNHVLTFKIKKGLRSRLSIDKWDAM